MIYTVDVADGATASIDDYIDYLAVECQAPEAAGRMLDRIWNAIESLELWPRRCSRAPEDEFREYEIRMMLIGPCVILFTINDEAQRVTIIAFRHGRQRPSDELPDANP